MLVDIDISAFRGELVFIGFGKGLPTGGVGGNWKLANVCGYEVILGRLGTSNEGVYSDSEFVSKESSRGIALAPFANNIF